MIIVALIVVRRKFSNAGNIDLHGNDAYNIKTEILATSNTNPAGTSHSERETSTHLPPSSHVGENDIPTSTNECYSTSRLPSHTRPRVHQQQDMQLTQNLTTDAITTVTNECYSTSRVPSLTHARVHQQNQTYITSGNIPMKTNECYGTTTPSMGSDLLYATVEQEHEYDYVIP